MGGLPTPNTQHPRPNTVSEANIRGLLALLLALGTLTPPRAFAADEIVLDNSAPSVQVSGAWTSASLTPGFTGADYLYRPASNGDATVFWPFPSNSSAGR